MTARRIEAASLRPLGLVPILALTGYLAGCQTAPPVIAPTAPPEQVIAGWPARRTQLQARAQFTAQGRIGVTAGRDGFQGHLRWVQDAGRSTVSLDGPLGIGGMRIVDEAGVLTLTNPSGEVLDNATAHDALLQRMGFEPPLESLRFWIQGVPNPALPGTETLGAQGYLTTLAQSGWTVTFSDYMQTPDGALPQNLTAARDDVRVKLVLQSWHSP